MNKLLGSFIVMCLCGIMASCSTGETEVAGSGGQDEKEESLEENEEARAKETENTEKVEENGPASSIEEIIEEKPGEFAGNAYNKAVIHKALDDMDTEGKDSFQLYDRLLQLMSESAEYKEHYEFVQDFNPQMETAVSGTPEGVDREDGETYSPANIVILLDASGSMAQVMEERTKMGLAKEAINEFAASMPEGANVSLRVYGHKGSSEEKDKKISCGSTEVVYELQPYDTEPFQQALGKFEPVGFTPLAKAIAETEKDFEDEEDAEENMIYVVSDGVESCGGDPVEEAKKLHESDIDAVVNIIGFDVNNEGQQDLLNAAEAGGGKFETVDTTDDFQQVWEKERVRLFNEWSSWSASNWNDVSSEQTNKKNELFGRESDFINATFQEETRLKNAASYLYNNEWIESDINQEVKSLAAQRQDILEEFRDEFDALLEMVDAEGDRLKDTIKEKGDDMKDKYGR
ncbi:VWA domain-containing protein [Salibacterium aidingense]|uniref:VWA domain-containing protein n=1 Tax=Salibacterium aidingense TaxID=384933 RepID=UPI003BECFDA1